MDVKSFLTSKSTGFGTIRIAAKEYAFTTTFFGKVGHSTRYKQQEIQCVGVGK